MKKYILLLLLLILTIIPVSFAYNDTTSYDNGYSDSNIVSSVEDESANEIYFDANALNDNGNGSKSNPYKYLTSARIVNNSKIHLSSGVYNYSGRKSFSNITMEGSITGDTIVSGGYLINNEYFSLSNLSFINTDISNKYDFKADNVIFRQYNSNLIHSSNGSIIINNCSFSDCYNINGGSLYVENTEVYINNSVFTSNSAGTGGAICCVNSNLSINNSVFKDNRADTMGGALTLFNSNSDIYNVSFINNTAMFNGGAVYFFDGASNISNSLFEYNNARIASAIYLDNISPSRITSNYIRYNNASKSSTLYIVASEDCIIGEDNVLTDNFCPDEDIIIQAMPDTFIGDGNVSFYQYIDMDNITLPESYDLRSYNQVTSVKNQFSDGNCWAFAALASLESCILKASGITYDFSENNMKNILASYCDYGWNYLPNNGGNNYMSLAYLTSWLGPVLECDDAYTISSIISPVLDSLLHIQDVAFIRRANFTDNLMIKEALIRYGAVTSSLYWNFSCSNGGNYYNNEINSANHAVSIVGWNDSYSRYNFKTTPEGDGAWIVKNSWGTASGEDGYYYISYYDATHTLMDYSFTFILNDSIAYDNNYQYDLGGYTDYFLNNTTTVYYKNIYTSRNDEYLMATSTYFNDDTNYTVRIYVNDNQVHMQEGFATAGYHTIKLNNPISLKQYDNFTVEFKITTATDAGVPISENITTHKYYYRENVSFISYDGIVWQDLCNLSWEYPNHIYYSQTASIKAFTKNTITKIKVESTDTNNCTIKATISDQYDNPITDGVVTFIINNDTLTLNNTNGTVIIDKQLQLGQNNITAIFNKNATKVCNDSITINVKTDSISTITTTITGHKLIIAANITDINNVHINTGKVVFKINGKTIKDDAGKVIYVKVVDSTANITYDLPDSLNNRTVNISVVYSGSNYISSSRNDSKVMIKIDDDTDISIIQPEEPVKANTIITIKAQITSYANGKVVFKLNGKTLKDENGKIIYLTPDENSIATLYYNLGNLKSKDYTLTAVLITNNKRIETNTTITVIQ